MPGVKDWVACWDVNTEASGYFLYWRSVSDIFDDQRKLDCGLSTTQPLTGIVPNGSYISATCYDDVGNESEFCEEILFDKDSVAPSCLGGFCIKEKTQGG